ncbi:MAG TPA: GNAT family N-acetyltransferase [Acidimicrobiales bacterium]|nr:GNAT family N-acetyltransferase [Acidimicrobiales bacterium]
MVRRIRADEGPELRAIRLQALRDSPAAFSSSLAREARQPAGGWDAAASRRCAGDHEATFVALDGEEWVGMVGAYRPLGSRSVVELVSLWTAPAARRRGVGAALVERVVAWAGTPYTSAVQLWVSRDNEGARRFYEALGFRETGAPVVAAPGPCRDELRMGISVLSPTVAR